MWNECPASLRTLEHDGRHLFEVRAIKARTRVGNVAALSVSSLAVCKATCETSTAECDGFQEKKLLEQAEHTRRNGAIRRF